MRTVRLDSLLCGLLALTVCGAISLAQSDTPSPAAGQMQQMDNMAITVSRMAETCEMMMKQEQAAMPYILGAGITMAAFLFVALVLLIILEIQWIKYWSWKLRYLGTAADAATILNQQAKPTA